MTGTRMHLPLPRSLRARLLLATAVAFAPLLGLYSVTQARLYGQVEAEWTVRASDASGRLLSAYREALEEVESVLTRAAEIEFADPGRDLCDRVLETAYAGLPNATKMGIIGPDGWTLCLTPEEFAGQSYDLNGVPYYQTALRTKSFSVSDFHIGGITGLPLVTAAQPVLGPDSSVVAVIAVGLNLAVLTEKEAVFRGGTATLFDAFGNVLARAPSGAPGLSHAVDLALLTRVSADPVLATDLDGVERSFIVRPVSGGHTNGADAALAIGYDPKAIAAEFRSLAFANLAGLIVASLLVFAMIWVILEFVFLRRIAPVIRASRELGTGELTARTGLSYGDDEIGRLAHTFDEMAENLMLLRQADAAAAAKELAERDLRFRQLAENIDAAFWMWDPQDRRVLYLSPGFEAIWGRPAEEAYANPALLIETVHPDDLREVRKRRSGGSMQEGEHMYRILRPDGTHRWIQNRTVAIRGSGKEVERYLGVAEDVTERRRLQESAQQSAKLEAVGQLAGGIAHDFNNVLTAIRGHTNLILNDLGEDHPLREDISEIDSAAERATDLTSQLLAFSRKQSHRPQQLDVSDLVSGLLKMIARVLDERIELVTELTPDLPRVTADHSHLEQAIVNLVVNARDAMPEGGTLTIRTDLADPDVVPPGSEGLMPREDYVTVEIIDSGAGMSEDTLEHIFEPFFTTKEQGQGTGLGLPSVYGTVKQSGGFIWVDSAEDVGTRFVLYFPASRETGVQAARLSGEKKPQTIERGSGRILLVEDEPAVRDVARRTLDRAGYDVVEAANGEEALEIFEHAEGSFDLLLTDVVMPRLGGPELYQRLREVDPSLPVLFMSGYPGRALGRHPICETAPFLQKPFTSATLAAEVQARIRPPPEPPCGIAS